MKQNGSILFLVLLLTAILSIASSLSFMSIKTMILRGNLAIHGQLAQQSASYQSTKSMIDFSNTLNDEVFCINNSSLHGVIKIEKTICAYNGHSMPIINYSNLFTKFNSCTFYPSTSLTHSKYGMLLTEDSVFSPVSCNNIPMHNSSFALNANLEIAIPINAPHIIFVNGFIDIYNDVVIDRNTLIVASGDLRIRNLISRNSYALTIVSATGNVIIENATKKMQVFILSSKQISIPSNVRITSKDLTGLLPLKPHLIYSLT